MSVDSLSRLIFYTDAGYHVIGMITMYNNRHQIVIDSNLDTPRDIELDKHNGYTYRNLGKALKLSLIFL